MKITFYWLSFSGSQIFLLKKKNNNYLSVCGRFAKIKTFFANQSAALFSIYYVANHYLTTIPLILIAFYQKNLSPLFPPTCRHFPTCSQYAQIAFEKKGFLKGSCLTIRRLCSCHPFKKPNIDLP